MKRNMSIALVVALIVTMLSIFATAANIGTVEIAFTPVAGEIPTSTNFQTKNTSISLIDPIHCVVYDNEKLQTLQSYNESTAFTDFWITFTNEHPKVSQIITGEKYIAITTMCFNENSTISDNIEILETNNSECHLLYVDKGDPSGGVAPSLYFYVVFTAPEPQDSNSTTGPSTPSSGTQTPSTFAPESHDVMLNYIEGTKSTVVYSFDITWGSMDFTYTAASEGTWNPSTHQFDNKVASSWRCEEDANKITVTNHSNTSITAALSFSPIDSFSELTSSFKDTSNEALTDSSLRIESAVGSNKDNAPSANAYLELSGDIDEPLTEKTKCGTVTVTIE